MGPKTLLQLLKPRYYSTLLDPLKDPFDGNHIVIIKTPMGVSEIRVPYLGFL